MHLATFEPSQTFPVVLTLCKVYFQETPLFHLSTTPNITYPFYCLFFYSHLFILVRMFSSLQSDNLSPWSYRPKRSLHGPPLWDNAHWPNFLPSLKSERPMCLGLRPMSVIPEMVWIFAVRDQNPWHHFPLAYEVTALGGPNDLHICGCDCRCLE